MHYLEKYYNLSLEGERCQKVCDFWKKVIFLRNNPSQFFTFNHEHPKTSCRSLVWYQAIRKYQTWLFKTIFSDFRAKNATWRVKSWQNYLICQKKKNSGNLAPNNHIIHQNVGFYVCFSLMYYRTMKRNISWLLFFFDKLFWNFKNRKNSPH